MDILKPEIFGDYPEITAGISTRRWGDLKKDKESRIQFLIDLGIEARKVAFPVQIHSVNVRRVNEPGRYSDSDALATSEPDLYLSVIVADCIPLFIYDTEKQIAGIIHAGRRGLIGGIILSMLQMLAAEWRSGMKDLIVYLGPSAGSCCYEVGEKVGKSLSKRYNGEYIRVDRSGRFFMELQKLAFAQLIANGVRDDKIEVDSRCTICNPDLFHSYRRDGEMSGRMMGVIGMRRIP